MNEGDFLRTAFAIRAVTVYGSPAQDREMKERIARAVAWLREATPRTGQDRSFRVLGLSWGHAERSLIEQAARDLIALQRVDGGWGQRDEMASDAYATGQTLYALLESGTVTASSEAVRRGTNYLLSTQRADGSWYVRSRAPKFQPYFEGGFPYGPDQWISSTATSWATTALASSIRADSTAARGKP
jgi:Squalene-hopene cyclase C-terminal domain